MADKRRQYTHILHLRAARIALAAGIALLTLSAARSAQAQTFAVLQNLGATEGANPYAGLTQATDGNLYGTAFNGGIGYGTLFKITPSGALTALYTFCSQSGCTDGQNPVAGLVQATNGNLYGTTESGGASSAGTVFKITSTGTLTTLYSFCSQAGCPDGQFPLASLVQGIDGNLYGTTFFGGGIVDAGTIFKITPSGALTTLYSFCSQSVCTDGSDPSGLVQSTDGNFYGTTREGGLNDYGTVFRITPTGTLTTLHSFGSQSTDGIYPYAGLVQATDGNFYGTTYVGGGNSSGTVFRIKPNGTLTTLYAFCSQSGCTDGQGPGAGLVQATDGSLYGTTVYGGANLDGTVFKVTPTGTLTTLHSFEGTDGDFPMSALVQGTDGNLYGTTTGGGASGGGTVFSLSMGLAPFVETQPTLGPVGIPVKILGTNLTGATSVTFNGTPAVFTVFSSSLIGAKVPAGATTGTVQVVTPSGTLSSNVPFRVRQ